MVEKQASSEIAQSRERLIDRGRSWGLICDCAYAQWCHCGKCHCCGKLLPVAVRRCDSREGVSRYILKSLCRGGIDDQSSVDASEYWSLKPGMLLNMALAIHARNRQRREMGKVGRISAHVTPIIRGGESGILGGTITLGRSNSMSRSDQMFLAGVLAALAVVKLHGEDTIFDEIVRSCGQDHLITEARRSGIMRWSGMADYSRRKK